MGLGVAHFLSARITANRVRSFPVVHELLARRSERRSCQCHTTLRKNDYELKLERNPNIFERFYWIDVHTTLFIVQSFDVTL